MWSPPAPTSARDVQTVERSPEDRVFEGMKGSTAAVEKRYTGDKIVGIAAMHKSNLVPIFNDQAAKDVATMRRG